MDPHRDCLFHQTPDELLTSSLDGDESIHHDLIVPTTRSKYILDHCRYTNAYKVPSVMLVRNHNVHDPTWHGHCYYTYEATWSFGDTFVKKLSEDDQLGLLTQFSKGRFARLGKVAHVDDYNDIGVLEDVNDATKLYFRISSAVSDELAPILSTDMLVSFFSDNEEGSSYRCG